MRKRNEERPQPRWTTAFQIAYRACAKYRRMRHLRPEAVRLKQKNRRLAGWRGFLTRKKDRLWAKKRLRFFIQALAGSRIRTEFIGTGL